MQTFLASPDFAESARVLDRQRLGKQRVETTQIMKALADPAYGWQNHPAVKMWRGHETALLAYQVAICGEWTSRGYRDTCLYKTQAVWDSLWLPEQRVDPPWLGDPGFHAAMRSNLLRKAPEWYGQWGWSEPDDLPYVWP